MKPIRTLIVDDEVHARRGLRTLLAERPDVEVVGEAADGDDAVAAIRKLKPDLVLLDVEMPGRSGIEVVQAVGVADMPAVVFITAYDQYAVAAFEAHALDYLLKPFTDERFDAAMQRARRLLSEREQGGLAERLAALVETRASGRFDRFTVRVGDGQRVYRIDEIDWIEADEYYVKLHVGDAVHMIRQTMAAFEELLPADRFVRIHRATIVNLERVVALEPLFQGDCTVVLRDGTRLRMSRRRREALGSRLPSFS